MRGNLIILAGVLAAMTVYSVPSNSAEYVVMRSNKINIRTGAGMDRVVVARAWKGDVFELAGESPEWYKIEMFTGDHRFVSKFWSTKLAELDSLPGNATSPALSESTRRSLYRDIVFAEVRARMQADEIIPPSSDRGRNRNLRKILEDRAILEVMEIYDVQPVIYDDLMEEAIAKDW
jgi:hypothetical protein